MTRGRILLLTLIAIGTAATIGWWQRGPLVARWHAHQLTLATDENRDVCAKALASWGERAIDPILSGLSYDDDATCFNLEVGLRATVGDWPCDDPRTQRAVERTLAQFSSLSIPGKRAALRFGAALISRDESTVLPANLARDLGAMMSAGAVVDELRPASLALAGALVERSPSGQWQGMARDLAIKGLADPSPATRLAAIELILREPLRRDNDLLARVAPFLRDREASLRRISIVALGPNSDVVREEHLLPLLHDDDPEIQRLCEIALQSRGLSDEHVRLARLISDPNPSTRLQVIPLLRQAADLDADVWLRRLTLDPAPAVRAAAIRVASSMPSDDLRQRLGEMAATDPSPTVREIARFYVDRTSVRKVGN